MTTEEKAKAYDKAIKKLRNAFYGNSSRMCEEYRQAVIRIIEPIFPELKKSEDERIRKALIKYFTLSDEHAYNEACGVSYRDIVAWLEKQGKIVAYYEDRLDECAHKYFNKGYSYKHALEKQSEPIEINPTEFDTRLQSLIGKFDSLPKEELIGSLSFWLNVVQNDGIYKKE